MKIYFLLLILIVSPLNVSIAQTLVQPEEDSGTLATSMAGENMRRLENLMQTFFQSDPESAQPFPREKREIINNLINDVISGAEQALAVAGTLSASDDCESLINDFAKPNLNDLKSEYEILLSNTSDSEEREIQMANYLVYSMFLATKIMAVHSSHETLLRCEANVPGW